MNWTQDFRFAFRMIWKKPWFSAAIVVTLALGMGINTTVFSLVNAVLFKPLPFPGGDRLVMAWASNSSADRTQLPVSYADFRDFRQAANSFERLEVFSGSRVIISENREPTRALSGCRNQCRHVCHAPDSASHWPSDATIRRKTGGGKGRSY